MKTSLLAAVCALALGVSQPGTGTTPPGTGPAVPGPGGSAPTGPGLGTPGAEPVDEKKVLTPEQIIRDKVEGWVRVEFTVGEYGQTLPPRRDATTPSVVVILEPKSVQGATYRLQVYVTEKVLARLGQLGIENLHTHLYGKVVRVSGLVKRVDYDKGGGYCHLVVENLDQFELIGAQPGSGTTPPENPILGR